MPGIPGMVQARPKAGSLRLKVWQSMRIMRRFSLPDLCRTTGARRDNVRKFVKRLEAHGYVALATKQLRGRPGSYHIWRLVKDTGPLYPTRCGRCGRPLRQPCEVRHD